MQTRVTFSGFSCNHSLYRTSLPRFSGPKAPTAQAMNTSATRALMYQKGFETAWSLSLLFANQSIATKRSELAGVWSYFELPEPQQVLNYLKSEFARYRSNKRIQAYP